MKPQQQQLAAMRRIWQSPDGRAFAEFLSAELAATDKRNRTLRGEELAPSQGRAQFIQSLIDTFESADDVLKKLTSQ